MSEELIREYLETSKKSNELLDELLTYSDNDYKEVPVSLLEANEKILIK